MNRKWHKNLHLFFKKYFNNLNQNFKIFNQSQKGTFQKIIKKIINKIQYLYKMNFNS